MRVDRYRLVEPIGGGGQATVWRADDPLSPGVSRAIKVVPVSDSRPNDLERIRREARSLAKLSHPGLLACHGLFEDLQIGLLGLVMDFVAGSNLADAQDDSRMTELHHRFILAHLAEVLGYVHAHDVVHRDLKLENVLVTRDFWTNPADPVTVKLVDFGIAAGSAESHPLTAVGHVIGTGCYMAPEVLAPAVFPGPKRAPAVDVFAFGILAVLLFRRAHPTGLSPRASLLDFANKYRELSKDPTWPPGVPPGPVGRVIADCLVLPPASRVANGQELASRMRRVIAENASGARSDAATAALTPANVSSGTMSAPGAWSATVTGTEVSPGAVGPGPATEPMAANFQAGPGVGAARPLIPPAPPRQARSSASPLVVAAAGAAGVGAVIAIGIAVFSLRPDSSESVSSLPLATAATNTGPRELKLEPPPEPPAAAVDPLPPRTPTVTAPRATRSAGCADDVPLCSCCESQPTCCSSGRDCAGYCDENLRRGETFRLRLSGARATSTTDLYSTNPLAKVCVSVEGKAGMSCTKLMDVRTRRASIEYLDVATEDLTQRGLKISVYDHTRTGTAERSGAKFVAIRRSAICRGLTFAGGFSGGLAVDRVEFFLDDPTNPRPTRCTGADPQSN